MPQPQISPAPVHRIAPGPLTTSTLVGTIERMFAFPHGEPVPPATQLEQLQPRRTAASGAETQLTEAELIERIRSWEELKAVAAAEQARLTAELYAARLRRE